MTNLFDFTYNQETLSQVFQKLGISEEQVEIIPWSIGNAVVDESGNIEGYITGNEFDGMNFSDNMTNILGSITSTNEHNHQLWGQFMNYISDLKTTVDGNINYDNVLGKEHENLNEFITDIETNAIDVEEIDAITSLIDFF